MDCTATSARGSARSGHGLVGSNTAQAACGDQALHPPLSLIGTESRGQYLRRESDCAAARRLALADIASR